MLCVVLFALASAQDAKSSMAQAHEAFFQHDVEAARDLFRDALAAGPSPDDRVEIEVSLATLAWRYFADPATARSHLDAAEAIDARPSASPAERSRMEASLGNFEQAREAALRSLDAALTAVETTRATVAFGNAVLDEAFLGRAVDAEDADRAVELVEALVAREPGIVQPSRLLVGLSLLAGDGPRALTGWRSYYHLAPGERPTGLLEQPAADLAEVLPTWSPADPSGSERVALALAASRFFAEAALAAPDATSPELRQIGAYARFVAAVRRSTDAYYRETALGRGSRRAWENEVEGAARVLWAELADPVPRFTGKGYPEELDRRFGAMINFGKTAGYRDLHMGHRVVDERREIAQYGHSAEVRFISLDPMVSNGFQTWAWDGRASHGGWADASTIVQVRRGYAEAPLAAWRALHDPDQIALETERIAEDTATDEAKATADPYAFLPGLSGRLKRQGQERLLAGLQARGLEGDDLRLAFLAAFERAVVESSIFGHEGRHAIDRGLKERFSAADLEFRAKLSEVAFAPEPRLGVGGVFNPSIGDATPHGIANLRIMEGLVAWMGAHAAEIGALDANRPLLPQFDRLTDDQIRAAFASMDPFAAREETGRPAREVSLEQPR